MKTTMAIACMVKTPELSPCKSRLAKTSSPGYAASVYEALLTHQENQLKSLLDASDRFQPYWAVAEESGMNSQRWKAFPKIYQGDGGLGARLKTVTKHILRAHHAYAFLGSDCPQFPYHQFHKTYETLLAQPNTAVISPSTDGGFNMLAANFDLSDIWTNVTYSSENTLNELKIALHGYGVQELVTLTDIDTADDCLTVLEEASELDSPLSETLRTLLKEPL